MKCKACNGTGKIMATIYQNDEIGFVDKTYDCCCCNGTGIIKVTNEEWFINLPTKEKAKALDLLMDGMSNLRFEIEEILNNGDFDMTHEEAVEMWLKQPHKE